jgi:hypothetical protein
VIVRDGGYRMAWVGMADSADGEFRRVAHAGPWSEDASSRQGDAALSLPLDSDGRSLGVLTIYAAEGTAFDTAEQSLLRELADDLAFGIQALRTAANERQAEQALRDSQSTLVMAMDLAGLAHWEFDARTNTFTLDERIYTQLGTTADREGGVTMNAEEYVRRFIPAGRPSHHPRLRGRRTRRDRTRLHRAVRTSHPPRRWVARRRAGPRIVCQGSGWARCEGPRRQSGHH